MGNCNSVSYVYSRFQKKISEQNETIALLNSNYEIITKQLFSIETQLKDLQRKVEMNEKEQNKLNVNGKYNNSKKTLL